MKYFLLIFFIIIPVNGFGDSCQELYEILYSTTPIHELETLEKTEKITEVESLLKGIVQLEKYKADAAKLEEMLKISPYYFTGDNGYYCLPYCGRSARITRGGFYPVGLIVKPLKVISIGKESYVVVLNEYGMKVLILYQHLIPIEKNKLYFFSNNAVLVPTCKDDPNCVNEKLVDLKNKEYIDPKFNKISSLNPSSTFAIREYENSEELYKGLLEIHEQVNCGCNDDLPIQVDLYVHKTIKTNDTKKGSIRKYTHLGDRYLTLKRKAAGSFDQWPYNCPRSDESYGCINTDIRIVALRQWENTDFSPLKPIVIADDRFDSYKGAYFVLSPHMIKLLQNSMNWPIQSSCKKIEQTKIRSYIKDLNFKDPDRVAQSIEQISGSDINFTLFDWNFSGETTIDFLNKISSVSKCKEVDCEPVEPQSVYIYDNSFVGTDFIKIGAKEFITKYSELYTSEYQKSGKLTYPKPARDHAKRYGKFWIVDGYLKYYRWRNVIDEILYENYDEIYGPDAEKTHIDRSFEFLRELLLSILFQHKTIERRR